MPYATQDITRLSGNDGGGNICISSFKNIFLLSLVCINYCWKFNFASASLNFLSAAKGPYGRNVYQINVRQFVI